jgi:hypothetical protein
MVVDGFRTGLQDTGTKLGEVHYADQSEILYSMKFHGIGKRVPEVGGTKGPTRQKLPKSIGDHQHGDAAGWRCGIFLVPGLGRVQPPVPVGRR